MTYYWLQSNFEGDIAVTNADYREYFRSVYAIVTQIRKLKNNQIRIFFRFEDVNEYEQILKRGFITYVDSQIPVKVIAEEQRKKFKLRAFRGEVLNRGISQSGYPKTDAFNRLCEFLATIPEDQIGEIEFHTIDFEAAKSSKTSVEPVEIGLIKFTLNHGPIACYSALYDTRCSLDRTTSFAKKIHGLPYFNESRYYDFEHTSASEITEAAELFCNTESQNLCRTENCHNFTVTSARRGLYCGSPFIFANDPGLEKLVFSNFGFDPNLEILDGFCLLKAIDKITSIKFPFLDLVKLNGTNQFRAVKHIPNWYQSCCAHTQLQQKRKVHYHCALGDAGNFAILMSEMFCYIAHGKHPSEQLRFYLEELCNISRY